VNGRRTLGDTSPTGELSGPAGLGAAVRLPGGWTGRLLLVVAVVSLVSFATQVARYGFHQQFPGLNSLERWFFVDLEMGVPAWLSASLLFLAGERLWRVGTAAQAHGSPWSRHWRVLAVVFVYLSLDELTEIHEQVIRPVKALLHLSGALAFAWVVVAVPLLVVFAVVFSGFLLALPRWTRWAFVISAACYVGGAVAVEMVGAALAEQTGVVTTVVTIAGGVRTVTETLAIPTVTYAVVVGVEEALEMVGTVLFLGAVTVALADVDTQLSQPTVAPGRSAAPADGDR
jgi:hypothetical protein